MGEIEIPKDPKRIVATQYLGHLLTLGVKPVGAGTASLNQYFAGSTDGIEDIGDDQAALEKIVSLDPDLIIRPSDKNYEQFAKIAPTIVIPWGAKDLYAECVNSENSSGNRRKRRKRFGTMRRSLLRPRRSWTES